MAIGYCGIHLRAILQAALKISLIHKIRLKNTLLKLQPDLPEDNELNQKKGDAQMWWFLLLVAVIKIISSRWSICMMLGNLLTKIMPWWENNALGPVLLAWFNFNPSMDK